MSIAASSKLGASSRVSDEFGKSSVKVGKWCLELSLILQGPFRVRAVRQIANQLFSRQNQTSTQAIGPWI